MRGKALRKVPDLYDRQMVQPCLELDVFVLRVFAKKRGVRIGQGLKTKGAASANDRHGNRAVHAVAHQRVSRPAVYGAAAVEAEDHAALRREIQLLRQRQNALRMAPACQNQPYTARLQLRKCCAGFGGQFFFVVQKRSVQIERSKAVLHQFFSSRSIETPRPKEPGVMHVRIAIAFPVCMLL